MIFAPSIFDEFLKRLFIVNNETLRIFNRDSFVNSFIDYNIVINKITNREYIDPPNTSEIVKFLDGLKHYRRNIGHCVSGSNSTGSGDDEVGTIDIFRDFYNENIGLKMFKCNTYMQLLTIYYVMDDGLRNNIRIDFHKVEEYFKNNFLNKRINKDDYIHSRAEILEL